QRRVMQTDHPGTAWRFKIAGGVSSGKAQHLDAQVGILGSQLAVCDRASIMWAWSSGLIHGTRLRTYMSNEAEATAIALSSAALASSAGPVWPSAAASHR